MWGERSNYWALGDLKADVWEARDVLILGMHVWCGKQVYSLMSIDNQATYVISVHLIPKGEAGRIGLHVDERTSERQACGCVAMCDHQHVMTCWQHHIKIFKNMKKIIKNWNRLYWFSPVPLLYLVGDLNVLMTDVETVICSFTCASAHENPESYSVSPEWMTLP